MSPALPWEVIERVIGHHDPFYSDDRKALYNFSLTCRELRPRSLCLLVAYVRITCIDDIFSLCDFLRAKPHLAPLVRTIAMYPTDLVPSLPLKILPNMTRIKFIEGFRVVLHQSILTHCRLSGKHIRTLQFIFVIFATDLEFIHLLAAFPSTKNLFCKSLRIIKNVSPHLVVTGQRASRRLQLMTLGIDKVVNKTAGAFLLELGKSTVETLSLVLLADGEKDDWHPLPQPNEWPQLYSLTLKPRFNTGEITKVVECLKVIHSRTLKKVTVSFSNFPWDAHQKLLKEGGIASRCSELEQELLHLPQPAITFETKIPISRRNAFWSEVLRQHFPGLHKRNAITFSSDRVGNATGHNHEVTSLAVSPDSKWIATGSGDFTIILWSSDGQVSREWVAHLGRLRSLAFSPDSRFLASAGTEDERKVAIWDISQDGALEVATLEGHSPCAWSPDGTTLAFARVDTGDQASVSDSKPDLAVCLWDVRTSQQLHLLTGAHHATIRSICFSPDGRWLASCGYDDHCCVLDITLGALHTVLRGPSHKAQLRTAAFHPDSMRLGTGSCDKTVRIWNAHTGQQLFTLEGHSSWVVDVAFSPDGTLVLSASRDGTVKIWDSNSGAMLLSLSGHSEGVRAASFFPCGRYIASASHDKTVRLWRTRDGSCVATFREHGEGVTNVAFSPDGRTLSSGARDGSVFIRRLCDVIPEDGCSWDTTIAK